MYIITKKFKASILILVVGLFCLGISIYCSRYELKTVKYNVSSENIISPITVVQLTDIHSSEFGHENEKLLSKIRQSAPDIIVITGDIINAQDDNISQSYKLISGLKDIAPVYMSLGNQEIEYMDRTGVDLKNQFSECGAIVLEKDYQDIEIHGQKIRIGGIYGYCLPEKYNSNVDEVNFLRKFEKTKAYKILLSHLPYAWKNYGFTAEYDIDLVFSGHVHGGQVIFPLIGGLYNQETGFFPGKMTGIFYENNTTVVLSSGLGSGKEKLPRINNIPEIVDVRLTHQ